MNETRINQLKSFLIDDPGDAFTLYALAMEYVEEAPGQALKYMQELLEKHPSYLPTYYHAAALLAEEGETEKAESVYKAGIELAKKQDDQHALAELQNAYMNFLYED